MKRIYFLLFSLLFLFSSVSYSQDFPMRGEIYNFEIGDVFHKIEKYLIDENGTGNDAVLVDSTIKIITVIDKYFFNDSNSVAYIFHRNLQTFTLDYNGEIIYTNSYENEYEDYYHDLQLEFEGDTLIQDSEFYNDRPFVIRENSWIEGGGNEEYYVLGHFVVGCGNMTSFASHFIWSNVLTLINDDRIVYYKKGDEEWGEAQTIVGLNELNQETELKIFPNPTFDYINVSTNEKSEIQIYNSTGQLLLRQKANSDNTQVDVSAFPADIYFVNLINEDGLIIGKSKFLKL